MTYSDITSHFNLYANLMHFLYVEKTEKQILKDATYDDLMNILADDVYQTQFMPLTVLIQPFIDSEYLNYNDTISDLNNYVNDLYNNGRTISAINNFETYRNINHFLPVENIYNLHYILEYYKEMCDRTLPTCWVQTPERFAVVNETTHKYFEEQSVNLLNYLT
jgi:hypothetical protein